MSKQRTAGLFIIVLVALIGGTLLAVKLAADHLLYQDATSTARKWARYVTDNVEDLEQIAGGEEPSSASMAFFRWSQQIGMVFRYEIFNREGYSQLVSDRHGIGPVDVSEYNVSAARCVRTGLPYVKVGQGGEADLPSFFAQAYVPVIVNGRAIAVVAADVDQTEERDRYYQTFLVAGISLCALTALAFGIPAMAWYRRTKEKQRADEEILFLAKHDGMTGLVNRGYLTERLGEALANAWAVEGCLAVHHIDLDRFKEVNDTLGHHGGDTLIKLMAERLRATAGSADIVARLGGDEFAIVQPGIADRSEADRLAQRLLDTMAVPFFINGHDMAMTASVGTALAPQDGQEPERLLRCADLALHHSKSDGRNRARLFTPDMDSELQQRLGLERCIRNALQDDGFELYFQPLVDMPDGAVAGYEALLRLRAEDGSPIPPSTFIPAAEEMGLIGMIGSWVIRKACMTAAQWPPRFTVAVNLSAAQFDAGNVCDVVSAALAEAALEPQRLHLEITESLLLRETSAVMTELARLKALGVLIVMDDFGTGYSSLSYLWRFPFDKIKIDRAFMQSLDSADKTAETIVKTIVGLGHSLQMRVTIEGVEDARQVAFVRDVDCDEVQGFYFGRPMPEGDLAAGMLAALHTGDDPRRSIGNVSAA